MTYEDVQRIVFETIKQQDEALVDSDITLEATLDSLKFDSLDVVEIANILEDRLNILIPDDVISKMRNVKDVVDEVEKLVCPKN